jgi:FAD/FMN-containing dehydrogenase/Fe-S oxidoreductase
MGSLADLLQELGTQTSGEVRADDTTRMLYATDASIYQQLPVGVVWPKHAEDCVSIVRFAAAHKIPLIPRAAGTSLAGQCVGAGLVVDVSRHMTRVLEIDPEARTATVEPGVVLDDLNDLLAPHGLIFGPETSTSNRCTISGMVGNNSCGTHSIIWGTTRDHTLTIDAVLSDGTTVKFTALSPGDLAAKREQDDLEGAVYATVCDAIDARREVILANYPRQDILRRNTGYALDRLALAKPWVEDGPDFNLCRLLCGSEGTLALTTKVKLALVPLPKHKLVVCVHCTSIAESMHGTKLAVQHDPAAVELMDSRILEPTRHNLEQARNRFWVEGTPEAVLAVEFFDDDPDSLEARAQKLIDDFRAQGIGYAYPVVRPPELSKVWALRKAGLGLLMGIPGDTKAITVIEDTAVAVADLPAYIDRIQALMHKYDTQCVYYAHASVGELHLRPELDLKTDEGLTAFKAIASDVADLVHEFGGSLSGEHGDGRLRAPFIPRMVGEEVYELLRRVKAAFDPLGIFNPGKIVDPVPIDHDLRISPDNAREEEHPTTLRWDKDFGLLRAAEKCNGAGACRKSPGRGTMCPSYMATRDELQTTRGRANMLRHVLTATDPAARWDTDELYTALDTCLSCKGCKSECPANVDMARMKAEYLQHRWDERGIPLRARIFGEFAALTRLAAVAPALSSWAMNTALTKRVLGVHPQRQIPSIAATTFGKWAEHRGLPIIEDDGPAMLPSNFDVVVFGDAFTHFNDPHIGIAAVRVMEAMGLRVAVTRGLYSGRTQISKGLLRSARAQLERTVGTLAPLARAGTPIVGLEPSAILTFHDEAPDLIEASDDALALADAAVLFEEFVLARGVPPVRHEDVRYLVHGHCHQKAIVGMEPLLRLLRLLPGAEVECIPSGCCGMAGSFGYEREHYDLSMKIGEMVLFPAVRNARDATIVAPGTSCRHQIYDGTQRTALHPAEVVARLLQA